MWHLWYGQSKRRKVGRVVNWIVLLWNVNGVEEVRMWMDLAHILVWAVMAT